MIVFVKGHGQKGWGRRTLKRSVVVTVGYVSQGSNMRELF